VICGGPFWPVADEAAGSQKDKADVLCSTCPAARPELPIVIAFSMDYATLIRPNR
jgi:hypothetical protein